MTIQPNDVYGSDATRALCCAVVLRAHPGSTAAEVTTYCDEFMQVGDAGDNFEPLAESFVTDGLAFLTSRSLVNEAAGEYSLASARYLQRVGDTEIELAAEGAAFRPGYMW